jgi:hypothetical protein
MPAWEKFDFWSKEPVMKSVKIAGVLAMCLVFSGCLSVRRWGEGDNPLYVGTWRYANKVYSGVDAETFHKVVEQSTDVGLNPWPWEKMTASRMNSEWVQMADTRRRLEIRIDKSKDEQGHPGYLVSLRVLLQRTSTVYTPTRTDYDWEPRGQDDTVERLILARIADGMRRYSHDE